MADTEEVPRVGKKEKKKKKEEEEEERLKCQSQTGWRGLIQRRARRAPEVWEAGGLLPAPRAVWRCQGRKPAPVTRDPDNWQCWCRGTRAPATGGIRDLRAPRSGYSEYHTPHRLLKNPPSSLPGCFPWRDTEIVKVLSGGRYRLRGKSR
jgi:hypothetical protein